MLSEAAGCAILTDVFTERGFTIARDVDFDEDGLSFNIDGWDAEARVGFEFRTSEAGDKDDLTVDELALLAARIEAGDVYIFVIDDLTVVDAADLRLYATRFLATVAARKAAALAIKDSGKHRRAPARGGKR